MAGSQLPVLSRRALDEVRSDIAWVDDADLGRLEEKSQLGAATLSLASGGGGHLYVGDYRRGLAMTAGQIGAAALGLAAGAAVAWLPFACLGIAGAVDAWRRARAQNRYLAARRHEYERNHPHPAAYRLLAAMSAADPTALRDAAAWQRAGGQAPAATPQPPPHPLVERLRKVWALYQAGAISEAELRARKIELLERHASGIARDDLDDLLYVLLPLLGEGALDDEDIEFVKCLEGA